VDMPEQAFELCRLADVGLSHEPSASARMCSVRLLPEASPSGS
jgi:hypothetical protein